jgi:hypothetical protein
MTNTIPKTAAHFNNLDWANIVHAYNEHLGYEKHSDTKMKVHFDQSDLTKDLKSFNDAISVYKSEGFNSVSLHLKGHPEAGAKLFHFIQSNYAFEDSWKFYIERFASVNEDNSFPFSLGFEKIVGDKGSTSLQEMNCHELGNLEPLSDTYNFCISDRQWTDEEDLQEGVYA